MKLIITESQMDKLYGYINGPKKKLKLTENQYKRLLMEYEMRNNINTIFKDIKVGDGILFSNIEPEVTKEKTIDYEPNQKTQQKEKIDMFEVLNIQVGESLKESGLFLKKIDDGRYPKNIFFLPKEAFITKTNIVTAFMSLKEKINIDKFDDKVADDIISAYEINGKLDLSIWKKFDIRDVGYIQISDNSKDFDKKEHAKFIHSMDLNVEKGEKVSVIDDFKTSMNNHFGPAQTYRFNFSDESWFLLNIGKKEGNKLYVEFLNDEKKGSKSIRTNSHDESGEAKQVINQISSIMEDYNIESIVLDISKIVNYRFTKKSDFKHITTDEKLKLIDYIAKPEDGLNIQNESTQNIISVDIPLIVTYSNIESNINEVTNTTQSQTIILNNVINITQKNYEVNIYVSYKEYKEEGWNNKTFLDSINKKPNKLLSAMLGPNAGYILGTAGGTQIINNILSKYGLYPDDKDISGGRNMNVKVIKEISIVQGKMSEYDDFKDVLQKNNSVGYYKKYNNGSTKGKVRISDNNKIIKYDMFIINELTKNTFTVNLYTVSPKSKIGTLEIELSQI